MNADPQQVRSRHAAVRKAGCLFYACCYIAGLDGYRQFDEAFDWATMKGLVRARDSYVQGGREPLIAGLIGRFGTSRRDGLIVGSRHHFWVEVGEWRDGVLQRREVYNSSIGRH
jgi:hypothetical protein